MVCVTLHLPPLVTEWLRPWPTTFWHFNRILLCSNKNENFLTMEIEPLGNYSLRAWCEQKKNHVFLKCLCVSVLYSLFSFLFFLAEAYLTHLDSLLFMSFTAEFTINRLSFCQSVSPLYSLYNHPFLTLFFNIQCSVLRTSRDENTLQNKSKTAHSLLTRRTWTHAVCRRERLAKPRRKKWLLPCQVNSSCF